MKLIVLGSGATVPHPRRTSSGYWLETSAGTILLDCSASIQSRAAAAGLDWPNLDAIWISHFHLDHVGGLPAYLQSTKHAEQMKEREKPLKIYGPVGISGLADRFSAVNNYRILEQPFPVEMVEVEDLEKFEILPGVEAAAMDTPHTQESLAIHIRNGEMTFVYTSDTSFDEKIASLARNVDLLLMECTFVKNKPAKKHLELAEAMLLIRKAKPKRAMLTHFYPEWDDVDFDKEVARFDPVCEVIEAVDGLEIDL